MTSSPASTSTLAAVPINDYVNSQTTSQTPDKPLSEIPISQPTNTDGLSTSIPTPDPYFTHFDPRIEHQSYKVGLVRFFTPHDNLFCVFYVWATRQFKNNNNFQCFHQLVLQEAQQRLEEAHREKVTRVMKDWSDLEERYQDMRLADPKSAQAFKQKMTARFQVVKTL